LFSESVFEEKTSVFLFRLRVGSNETWSNLIGVPFQRQSSFTISGSEIGCESDLFVQTIPRQGTSFIFVRTKPLDSPDFALLPSLKATITVGNLSVLLRNNTPTLSEDIVAIQLHNLQTVVEKTDLLLSNNNLDSEQWEFRLSLSDLQIDNMTSDPYFLNVVYSSKLDQDVICK
jgi:hypothetical protein